jgi:hypothetical protein
MTLTIHDIEHINALPLCWVSHFIYWHAEWHYAEYRGDVLRVGSSTFYRQILDLFERKKMLAQFELIGTCTHKLRSSRPRCRQLVSRKRLSRHFQNFHRFSTKKFSPNFSNFRPRRRRISTSVRRRRGPGVGVIKRFFPSSLTLPTNKLGSVL